MNSERLLRTLGARVRGQPAPEVDVVQAVMHSIRRNEATTTNSRRILSLEAVAALVVAGIVAVPAMQSLAMLLDPMVSLFSGFEAAFR